MAGETAAALAAASIVFNSTNATYSNICLDHARQLYTFAQQNLGIYSNSVPSVSPTHFIIFKKSVILNNLNSDCFSLGCQFLSVSCFIYFIFITSM